MSDERQIRYCYLEQWKTLGGLSLQHPGFQYQIVADLRHVDARSLSLRCWKVPASGILTLCAEYVRRAVLLLEWAEATGAGAVAGRPPTAYLAHHGLSQLVSSANTGVAAFRHPENRICCNTRHKVSSQLLRSDFGSWPPVSR